jgi:hypothetical protein
MIILKVSHILAKANQEKTREMTLYCESVNGNSHASDWSYQALDMEKKHAYWTVPRFVKFEKVNERILIHRISWESNVKNQVLRTTEAAKEPLSQRLR